MASFALTKIPFKGQQAVFNLYLVSMMIGAGNLYPYIHHYVKTGAYE